MSSSASPTASERAPLARLRLPIALALIALSALVLFTRTYVRFDSVRIKLITSPVAAAPDGSLDVPLTDSPRIELMGSPTVLVLRLERAAGKQTTISVRWNENQIDTVKVDEVEGKDVHLVLPARFQPKAGDTVRFRAREDGWAVSYLEVANVHGSSRGLIDMVFLPAPRPIEPERPYVLFAFALAFIAWLQLRVDPPIARKLPRIIARVAGGLFAALFLLALVSPFISDYKIGIAFGTVMTGVGILSIDGLCRAWRELRDGLHRLTGAPRAVNAVAFALLGMVPFLAMSAEFLQRYDGNYSGFLHITQKYVDNAPVLQDRPDLQRALHGRADTGYDGQFVYLMAFDPFLLRYADRPQLYREMIDAPPYRYGRIGFSVLTKAVSLNQPQYFPQVMVWLILASHLLAMLCLGAIIAHYKQHPAWALAYVAVPGYWASLWAALPESIAGLCLLTAVLCVIKSRVGLAALALAASLLFRETGAILVVAFALWYLLARREPRHAIVIAASLVPLALWRIYVGVRLYSDFGREGFFFNAQNVGAPFKGLLDLLNVISTGTYSEGNVHHARGATAYAVVITVMLIIGIVALWKRRDAIGGAMAAYGLLAVSLTYPSIWIHWGNGERGTYEMFLLAIVALVSVDARAVGLRRLLAASVAMAAVYTIYYSSFAADLQGLF